jgi:hypothetical protein
MELLTMKEMLLVFVLIFTLGCAAPEPEGGEPGEAEVAADVTEQDEELEIPPEGSVPLSEIIASIEIEGHTWITEVEFEDGVWEVEFVVGDEGFELEIDPMTGEALSDEPHKPDDD